METGSGALFVWVGRLALRIGSRQKYPQKKEKWVRVGITVCETQLTVANVITIRYTHSLADPVIRLLFWAIQADNFPFGANQCTLLPLVTPEYVVFTIL